MTDAELVAEARERHAVHSESPAKWCEACGQSWGENGCDAIRLVEALERVLDDLRHTRMAAEAVVEGLDSWQAQAERWRRRVEKMEELVAAKADLLTAYRLGNNRRLADRALTRMGKAQAALEATETPERPGG